MSPLTPETLKDETLKQIKSKIAGKSEAELEAMVKAGELDDEEESGSESDDSDMVDIEELFPGKTPEEIKEMFKGKSEDEIAEMLEEAGAAMDSGSEGSAEGSEGGMIEMNELFPGKTDEELEVMFADKTDEECKKMIDDAIIAAGGEVHSDDEDEEDIESLNSEEMQMFEGKSEEEIRAIFEADGLMDESDEESLNDTEIENILAGKRKADIPKSNEPAAKKSKIVELVDEAEKITAVPASAEEKPKKMSNKERRAAEKKKKEEAAAAAGVKVETKTETAKPAEKKEAAKPAEKKDAAKPVEKKEATKPAEKKEVEKKERTLPNGMIIEDTIVGNGPTAAKGKKVGMRYIGKLTVFTTNSER
jgi:hypothetical protein